MDFATKVEGTRGEEGAKVGEESFRTNFSGHSEEILPLGVPLHHKGQAWQRFQFTYSKRVPGKSEQVVVPSFSEPNQSCCTSCKNSNKNKDRDPFDSLTAMLAAWPKYKKEKSFSSALGGLS